jgi:RMKL-like, methyltransferase domain
MAVAVPARSEGSLSRGLRSFAKFAYQRPPLSRRNWGHPLHSLCSYPSKLKPGLARCLIDSFTSPGHVVLDPFCGVGTVPMEACLQGRLGIGADLSPFAALVAKAKLAPASPDALADALNDLEMTILQNRDAVDLLSVEPEIRSFFHDDTCREVLVARAHLISSAAGETSAGRVLASAICHILHGNRPYALSRRSHGIIPIPPKGAFVYKSLMDSLRAKVARLAIDDLPEQFVPGTAFRGDASEIPLDDDSVNAVITSPPFLGTTEFLRQNRVRLWFSGMSYDEQKGSRSQFAEYQRSLDFYADMLSDWARVLRLGGRLVMHLGIVRNRDMAKEISPYAEGAGFSVVKILYEPTDHLESHGRTARGATHTHEFLIAELR